MTDVTTAAASERADGEQVGAVGLFGCVLREVDDRVRTALVEQGHTRLSGSESIMLRAAASGVRHRAEYLSLLGVTQQAVSKSLRHLQDLGYVRARADPSDLRLRLMHPTSWGLSRLRLIDQIRREVNEQLRSATGELGGAYESILRGWLESCAQALATRARD